MLCAGVAQAQVQTSAAPPGATDGAGAAQVTDEIVVTAQFRTQRLQDVPIAVSAVSGEALQQAHVRSLEDLSAAVPSFSVAANSNYGAAPISLRGVGGANGGGNVFADEPVAVYFDGAVVSRPRYSSLDLVDVDSIEVLRGPQGTLYGRNSSAGAVLLKSAAPTEDFYGYIDGSAGSYHDFRVRGALSGPLDHEGRLLARLAVGYSDYGGWARNYDGKRLGGSRDVMVRGTLLAKPTDQLTLKLITEYSDQNSHPAL
ncbi:MAG TPA: TonB-dependent receptor plug domain-containing protein, partial [Phenylobacterium sp.]|uniref:TonB-dependent receptor n=1 Tax=Phenylobacterium sp. TaxID=1871053 RepID=UPI002B4A5CC7